MARSLQRRGEPTDAVDQLGIGDALAFIDTVIEMNQRYAIGTGPGAVTEGFDDVVGKRDDMGLARSGAGPLGGKRQI